MKTATPFVLIGALSLGFSPLHAERGMLNADGILVVKGADISSARITIVPENAVAYGLEVGTKRFTLHLPVNDTYLVSFVREGCPTKEVYFDTRVPVESTHRDFDFPFQVTLEHLSAERMFAYEGPVGFVRYQHPLADFGYETQYVVKVNEEMHERMMVMEATGTDPKVMRAPMAAMVVDVSRDGRERTEKAARTSLDEDGTVAAVVSEVPALVHRVSGPKAPEEEVIMVAENVVASEPEPVLEVVEEPVVMEVEVVSKPEPAASEVRMAPAITAVPPAPKVTPAVAHAAQEVPLQDNVAQEPLAAELMYSMERLREEEVLVDRRMITRVVRFVRPDGAVTDELRKVTHAFGATFYFHNAQSITERAFLELTAEK